MFKAIVLAFRWEGKDEKEVGRCQETGVVHVKVDPKYYRPTEVVSRFKTVSSHVDKGWNTLHDFCLDL